MKNPHSLPAQRQETTMPRPIRPPPVPHRTTQRPLPFPPALPTQRVPPKILQSIHLVIARPAARTAIYQARPLALLPRRRPSSGPRGSKPLRPLIDAVAPVPINRELPRRLGLADPHRPQRRALRRDVRRVRQLDDEELLDQVAHLLTERPARVDKVDRVAEREERAVDGPLRLRDAGDRTEERPGARGRRRGAGWAAKHVHPVRDIAEGAGGAREVDVPTPGEGVELWRPEVGRVVRVWRWTPARCFRGDVSWFW